MRFRNGLLASAGADASVKLWRLADWLPPDRSSSGGGQPAAESLQGLVVSDLPVTPETPSGTGGEAFKTKHHLPT